MTNTIKSFNQIYEGNDIIENEDFSDFLLVVKRIMSKDPSMEINVDVDDSNYFDMKITFPEYECNIVGLIQGVAYPNALFADWFKGDKNVDVRGNAQIVEMLANNYNIFVEYLTNIIKALRK
jgi:hypothetical protein